MPPTELDTVPEDALPVQRVASPGAQTTAKPAPGEPAATSRRGWRHSPGATRALTVLAAVLIFAALVFPNVLSRLTPVGFVRIPVEAVALIGALAALPPRARRALTVVIGPVLGWLVVQKCLDMGFFAQLDRPFNPVLDWTLLDDAYGFVAESYGRAAAVGALGAVLVLVVAVMVVTTWATLRVGRLVGGHRRVSAYASAGAAVAWALALVLGLSVTAGVPVAARSTATYAVDRFRQVRAGLADRAAFAAEVRVDAFAHTPPAQLLTALRGKDVIFTFVESYGRSAVEAPGLAPGVDKVLDDGTATLRTAGFAARSGWLTSPTYGGGSWFAHSTFESGLWITNQQRYRDLVATDRLTLTSAFKKIGVHTVSVMPGTTRAWPEGRFYGYDTVWDARNLGYRGPKFGWAPIPDQFTLRRLNELEYQVPNRGPVMVEMPLVSSHTPWTPLPTYLEDWNQIGDGSVYRPMAAAGTPAGTLWQDKRKVREQYGKSIEYTLTSLVNWVRNYGNPNLVLVFLGDHQASPIVSGDNASHDVPVTIVAKDPAVLDRVAGWGWDAGLRPSTKAPVWPMNAFRDRFLTAFGSTPHP